MDHYENVFICKKDVSCAGDSPGINFKANSQLLFLLFDNWCYKMIIVPGPRTKAFDVRNLVLPYMNLPFFVELFSCPTIYKIPETCPRTAAARCRGAIQPGIFTAQTYCVSSSQRQGLTVTVPCHQHHLPAGGPYMIRMKTSQKQARKMCKVNIIFTQYIRRVLRSSFLQRKARTSPFVVSFQ